MQGPQARSQAHDQSGLHKKEKDSIFPFVEVDKCHTADHVKLAHREVHTKKNLVGNLGGGRSSVG